MELGPVASNRRGGSRLLLTLQRDYSHSASAKGTPRARPSKVRLPPPSARLRSSSGLFILRISLDSACSQNAHLQPCLLQGNKLACVLLPGFVYLSICAFAYLFQLFVLIHRTIATQLLARSAVQRSRRRQAELSVLAETQSKGTNRQTKRCRFESLY